MYITFMHFISLKSTFNGRHVTHVQLLDRRQAHVHSDFPLQESAKRRPECRRDKDSTSLLYALDSSRFPCHRSTMSRYFPWKLIFQISRWVLSNASKRWCSHSKLLTLLSKTCRARPTNLPGYLLDISCMPGTQRLGPEMSQICWEYPKHLVSQESAMERDTKLRSIWVWQGLLKLS